VGGGNVPILNPYLITEPTCISFSGGRTSAYMLYQVLQANNGLPSNAVVCFANTGKEDAATLRFVHDCETNWNVPIVWLEFKNADEVKDRWQQVTYETASRKGEPFEAMIDRKNYLPNTFARFCTQELKIIPINKYLASIGITDFVTFVGIRADEPRRVAKMRGNKDIKETPLATAGVCVNDVLEFWNNHSFNLDTVTVNGNSLLSNCDLCFLKKADHLLSLIKDKPERAVWWVRMEQKIGATFNQAHPSYASMMKFAANQSSLFDQNEESIACFCGD
jgi:3'-phosphoadenosine 5'-phosphosulfate sulfotransferase (PAPS reductase)/FAD synthetase